MILINAKDFGIIPGMEITEKLTEMLAYSATVNGSKTSLLIQSIFHRGRAAQESSRRWRTLYSFVCAAVK